MTEKSEFREMRSFDLVICRAYFKAQIRRNYAKNVVINRSALSLLYEDGHPRCKGFRFGVKCAVRRKSGQKKKKKKKIPTDPDFPRKKKKKKKPTYRPYAKFMMKSET